MRAPDTERHVREVAAWQKWSGPAVSCNNRASNTPSYLGLPDMPILEFGCVQYPPADGLVSLPPRPSRLQEDISELLDQLRVGESDGVAPGLDEGGV